MMAHELIDRALAGPALVSGSLPPAGRDLDLLVRPTEEAAIVRALSDARFLRRDAQWVRFARCTVEIVEIIPAAAWRLPAHELDALFADARPLDGVAQLVRPAPHHAILILARRVASENLVLDARRRERLARALEEDRDAWHRARERAPAWGAVSALERLASNQRPRAARSRGAALARLARRHVPRLRRPSGAVIALSGLDGAGKSTQALALRDTFERLAYDTTIAWTRIAWDDSLWRLALPAKTALTAALRLIAPAPAARAPTADAAAGLPDDPVKRVRESSALLTETWTLVIAFVNAISQRRLTRGPVRRGTIVICDRYTLDSIVALRFDYGRTRRFRAQRAVIAALSPTPRRAFLLDVRPETAYARKGEGGVDWLAGHRALYQEEYEELGVRLLDGERATEELCAEIARDVWESGL
jgi:thymidylate kinase